MSIAPKPKPAGAKRGPATTNDSDWLHKNLVILESGNAKLVGGKLPTRKVIKANIKLMSQRKGLVDTMYEVEAVEEAMRLALIRYRWFIEIDEPGAIGDAFIALNKINTTLDWKRFKGKLPDKTFHKIPLK